MKQMKKRFILKRHLLTLTILFLLIMNSLTISSCHASGTDNPFPQENTYSIIPRLQNIQSNTSVLSFE